MTAAREIMTGRVQCVGENEPVQGAACKVRELEVGALPICGDDGRLKDMVSDRDIVFRSVANGDDLASVKVSAFADGKPVTIGADDSVEDALRTMADHRVRRLPVIDGHDLVGIVSQADIARNLPEDRVGVLIEAISR